MHNASTVLQRCLVCTVSTRALPVALQQNITAACILCYAVIVKAQCMPPVALVTIVVHQHAACSDSTATLLIRAAAVAVCWHTLHSNRLLKC
jgi:hypothetical protein